MIGQGAWRQHGYTLLCGERTRHRPSCGVTVSRVTQHKAICRDEGHNILFVVGRRRRRRTGFWRRLETLKVILELFDVVHLHPVAPQVLANGVELDSVLTQ